MPIQTIPKIIHQTWKTTRIPLRFLKLQASWQHHHPDWEYRLWTDAAIAEFMQHHYAWFMPTFNSYQSQIERVDAWRVFVLWHYGGLYVDLDFEALKPLDPLLAEHICLMGYEPPVHAQRIYKFTDQLPCNACMASIPRHPFWQHYMEHLIQLSQYTYEKTAVDTTGPLALRQIVNTYSGNDIHITDSNVLYPLSDCINPAIFKSHTEHQHTLLNLHKFTFSEQTYAVHWWSGTYFKKEISLYDLYYRGKAFVYAKV